MRNRFNIRKLEHILVVLNISIALFTIIVVGITWFAGKYEPTRISRSEDVIELDRTYMVNGDVQEVVMSFPYGVQYERGKKVTFSGTLPENIDDNCGIMLNTNYCSVKVYAKDELIGSYAVTTPLSFGRLVGNIRLIVPVEKEYAGCDYRIEAVCYYSGKMTLNGILFGNIDGLKLDVIFDNSWRILIAVSLITLSILCLGISISKGFINNYTNNWAFYHLAFFSFFIQLWLICSSDIPQLLTNANEVVSLLSYISLAALPIHFAGFCTEILPGTRLYFSLIQLLGWIHMFFMIFGFVTGLFDPPEILKLNHLLIVACMILSIFLSVRRCKKDPDDREAFLFTVGVAILVFTVALALAFFYKMPTSGIDGIILALGIFAFAMFLFALILKIEIRYITQLQKNDIYKELAYKDIMTETLNRTAFNENMAKLNNADINTVYDMVILDINRLKRVNDYQGHEVGDRLIIGAAECINKSFNGIADVYRIGGDEFAVIVANNHRETLEAIDRLDEEIASFARRNPDLSLSISRGVATMTRTELTDNEFSKKLYRAADERMYEDKEHWHEIL